MLRTAAEQAAAHVPPLVILDPETVILPEGPSGSIHTAQNIPASYATGPKQIAIVDTQARVIGVVTTGRDPEGRITAHGELNEDALPAFFSIAGYQRDIGSPYVLTGIRVVKASIDSGKPAIEVKQEGLHPEWGWGGP